MHSDAVTAGRAAPRWLACALLALMAAAPGGRAAEPDLRLSENDLKAALIYNYTQFIEWPAAAFARPNAPFQICIVGNAAIRAALMGLERRQHRGHPISVVQPSGREGLAQCHVLYVDNARSFGAATDITGLLGDAPTLTISSASDATENGFAIGFVTRDDRVRWNMNLHVARRAHLKISANLIEIAVSVVGESGK
jgi:hypothetical protein